MSQSKEKSIQSPQLTWKQSLAVIVGFCLFFWFFWGSDKPKEPREISRADKAFYMVETSKDGVRALLKDPKSAVFQDVIYVDHLTPAVCGKVNSRNGFGGMSGFQHFMAHGENLIVFEKQMDDFGDAWNKLCVR